MIRSAIVILAALALAGTSVGQVAPERGVEAVEGRRLYAEDVVVRAVPADARQLLALTSLARSVWSHGTGIGVEIDVQMDRSRLPALQEAGVRFEVIVPDLAAAIAAEREQVEQAHTLRDAGFFTTYRTCEELDAFIDQLQAQYPQLVSTFFVGFSVEGRPIRGLRITGPGDAAARPGILLDGMQHAREWISPMTVAYIADQLLGRYETDTRVRALIDNLDYYIVPVVNPDGYAYTWTSDRLWRKNRRNNGDGSFGVDLNRNWPVQWGTSGTSTNPGDETFCGTGPLSEPETAQLAQFMTGLSGKLVAHIDFHSYSQLVLWPYSYGTVSPPEPDKTAVTTGANLMRAAIGKSAGVGYQAMRSADLYASSGDIIDWSYRERHNKAFTIELRDTGNSGFILPASEILPVGRENFDAVVAMSELFAAQVRFTLPEPLPVVMTPDASTSVRVTLAADYSSIAPGSAKIYTRVKGSAGIFTPADLTLQTGTTYAGPIPAVGCGSSVEYYFEAANAGGVVARYPLGAPSQVFTLDALSSSVVVSDPCEVAGGWTVGAPGDTATAGKWQCATPLATSAQPGADHSAAGVNCWITDARAGSSAGTYDVDNGATSLISPVYDLASVPSDFVARDGLITYWVWFSNSYLNRPDDVFPIWLSNDAGQSWSVCDLLSTTTGAWVQRSVRVQGLVGRTQNMRLKFVAQDFSPTSTVECGVDDVTVALLGCQRSAADIDGDGDVDLDDFFAFFGCFDTGGACADTNHDGSVDLEDFFLFFNAFDHAG